MCSVRGSATPFGDGNLHALPSSCARGSFTGCFPQCPRGARGSVSAPVGGAQCTASELGQGPGRRRIDRGISGGLARRQVAEQGFRRHLPEGGALDARDPRHYRQSRRRRRDGLAPGASHPARPGVRPLRRATPGAHGLGPCRMPTTSSTRAREDRAISWKEVPPRPPELTESQSMC